MNPLEAVQDWIIAVMGLDPNVPVIIGRENLRRENMSALQIVVDSIAPATRLAKSSRYDGDGEAMTYSHRFSAPVTVNFYGDDALNQSTRFALLLMSQAGLEAQESIGISLHNVSTATNLKLLTGEQYSQRYEIALNVQYTTSLGVDTLRIDTLQETIIFNE